MAILAVILASLVTAIQAIQPSAPEAVAAPLRELPLGQLNFLHTTDTHGWHAGHLQEASYGADWGDYISFAQRLRERIEAEGNDLLLIDTGDRVDGNGLYDASNPTGKYMREIFPEQKIDVVCSGNHELYKANTTTLEYEKLIPVYGGNYLASNIDIIDPKAGERRPLAQRFRKFETKNHGIRVTAFGFIFDFTGNDNNSFVQPVEDTIKEQWFQDAIRDQDVDIFVLSGHIGLKQSESTNLFQAIRDVRWDIPIVFFGGHTHIRDYKKYDDKAYGLESGRYMETIGFQSVSGLSSRKERDKKLDIRSASFEFARRYIDNNLFSFYSHTGLNSSAFPTEHGKNVSERIRIARKALSLDQTFGCCPRSLWMARTPYPHEDSIYTWLESQVIPEKVIDEARKDKARIIYANTGAMRFDIFEGPFTRDSTFIVSPFTSGYRYIKDVPYSIADKLLLVLNHAGNILSQAQPHLEEWRLVPPEQIGRTADTVVLHKKDHLFHVQSTQYYPYSQEQTVLPGYTTYDDAGNDGDDTIHSEISFYRVPNCIESRVNLPDNHTTKQGTEQNVDVVFLEFIQPWMLAALEFSGAEYTSKDTAAYVEGKSFTEMIAEWVSENWKGNC